MNAMLSPMSGLSHVDCMIRTTKGINQEKAPSAQAALPSYTLPCNSALLRLPLIYRYTESTLH